MLLTQPGTNIDEQSYAQYHLVWNEFWQNDYLVGVGAIGMRGCAVCFLLEDDVTDYIVAYTTHSNRIVNERPKMGRSVGLLSTGAGAWRRGTSGSIWSNFFTAGIIESDIVPGENPVHDVWILVQNFGHHDGLAVYRATQEERAGFLSVGNSPGDMILSPIDYLNMNAGFSRGLGGVAQFASSLDPAILNLDGSPQSQPATACRWWGLLLAAAADKFQVVTGSTSAATGTVLARLDTTLSKLYIEVTHNVAAATAVLLKGPALPGVDSVTTLATLTTTSPSNNVVSSLTTQQMTDLKAGKYYVAVETATGEKIRGQVAAWSKDYYDNYQTIGLYPMTSRTGWYQLPLYGSDVYAGDPPRIGPAGQLLDTSLIAKASRGQGRSFSMPGWGPGVVGFKYEGPMIHRLRGQADANRWQCPGWVDCLTTFKR